VNSKDLTERRKTIFNFEKKNLFSIFLTILVLFVKSAAFFAEKKLIFDSIEIRQIEKTTNIKISCNKLVRFVL
jgi:hypothetical protein